MAKKTGIIEGRLVAQDADAAKVEILPGLIIGLSKSKIANIKEVTEKGSKRSVVSFEITEGDDLDIEVEKENALAPSGEAPFIFYGELPHEEGDEPQRYAYIPDPERGSGPYPTDYAGGPIIAYDLVRASRDCMYKTCNRYTKTLLGSVCDSESADIRPDR